MIIDYIDYIEIDSSITNESYEIRNALNRLGEGLDWIYRVVKPIEVQIEKKALQDNTPIVIVGGLLNELPLGIIACAFQWYAVSACNYAQIVGWVKTRNRKKAKEYVGTVMPKLQLFRNKVAAHLAITDPHEEDNIADLEASVNTQVIYAQGRLLAGSISPIIENNEELITISKDLSWSLTKHHEMLIPRYWPYGVEKSTQAIKVNALSTIKFKVSYKDLLEDLLN